MKTIFLVDIFLPSDELNNIKSLFGKRKIIYANTTNCTDKENEYQYIKWIIHNFMSSNNDVLLVNFSGSDEVAREVGDESNEMVIPLIAKDNSSKSLKYQVSLIKDMLNKTN